MPEAVQGTGGIHRWNDGREVVDHVYCTFEYPGGRTAVFSSIESNAFDRNYEVFYGTKGTLILQGESEAYLFQEGGGAQATGIEVQAKNAGPALEASESRAADAAGRSQPGTPAGGSAQDRLSAYRHEVSGFCAAIRVGTPLRCGPDKAIGSAIACLVADDAVTQKTRLPVPAPNVPART
jgi:predicted dehydrogenase